MPKMDAYEAEILRDYEEGKLKSIASKAELAKFKVAARATIIEDQCENSSVSGNLSDS